MSLESSPRQKAATQEARAAARKKVAVTAAKINEATLEITRSLSEHPKNKKDELEN